MCFGKPGNVDDKGKNRGETRDVHFVSRAEARRTLKAQGFEVERVYSFNKAGAPPWWAYSKVFGSEHINKVSLKIFDKAVWLWRRFDPLLPWPGLSLIIVARRPVDAAVPEKPGAGDTAVPEMSSREG